MQYYTFFPNQPLFSQKYFPFHCVSNKNFYSLETIHSSKKPLFHPSSRNFPLLRPAFALLTPSLSFTNKNISRIRAYLIKFVYICGL